jgi:Na+-transporting NADH:ubiquinone oxidoreductase subunit C
MSNDSIAKTLLVAIGLSLVCSVIVSVSAVGLKPRQEANAEAARRAEILRSAGLLEADTDVDAVFRDRVEARVLDLDSGQIVADMDPDALDGAATSTMLPPEEDIAGIVRRPRYVSVYLVRDGDDVDKVVLPVHGYGLWSTMYGFLALGADGNTVEGLSFYQHGETPGLGGEIENPRWLAGWQGKKVYGDGEDVRLGVIKGQVDPESPQSEWQVDGLSGATLTSNGVTNMIHYWLGDGAFGPFLARLRNGESLS